MLRKNFFKVLALLAIPCALISDQEGAKSRMVSDLHILQNAFRTQYAPIEWKESFAGWSLDSEIQKAIDKVINTQNISVKNYQTIVKDFFLSTQDYHVSVQFYSTEASYLPIQMRSANGKYFITGIDRSQLPKQAGKIAVGDQVISFNKIPIAKAMKDFEIAEVGPGGSLSHGAFAELFFMMRLGSLGHMTPKGPASIEILHKGAKSPKSYTLTWSYYPEEIKNITPFLSSTKAAFSLAEEPKWSDGPLLPLNKNPIFKKSMQSPHYRALKHAKGAIFAATLGARESFIPTLGKKLWESNAQSQFYAYIFETADKNRIGYIRIPHYDGSQKHVKQFAEIIQKLEMETSLLIIDQVNNPGGSVFYMYALASMLTTQPLHMPSHRISLTQKEVAFAVESLPSLSSVETDEDAKTVIGDWFEGIPVTKHLADQMRDSCIFTIEEWEKGHLFTDPTYIFGYDQILPHPSVRYTKPILVLINQLDISCGDFFPAILQDNQRATLFGTRTAGAGGFVLRTDYPNLFGIESFNYTGSIAARVDNHPIENLGVTPDVLYPLCEEDLTNNYTSYASHVLEQVKKMLQ